MDNKQLEAALTATIEGNLTSHTVKVLEAVDSAYAQIQNGLPEPDSDLGRGMRGGIAACRILLMTTIRKMVDPTDE